MRVWPSKTGCCARFLAATTAHSRHNPIISSTPDTVSNVSEDTLSSVATAPCQLPSCWVQLANFAQPDEEFKRSVEKNDQDLARTDSSEIRRKCRVRTLRRLYMQAPSAHLKE